MNKPSETEVNVESNQILIEIHFTAESEGQAEAVHAWLDDTFPNHNFGVHDVATEMHRDMWRENPEGGSE